MPGRHVGHRTAACIVMAATLSCLLAAPASAGPRWFGVQRLVGAALVAAGGVALQQGFDYRDQSDRFHERARLATDTAEQARLSELSDNRSVKSQVTWALAGSLALGGVRLLATAPMPDVPKANSTATAARRQSGPERPAVAGLVRPGQVGLRLRLSF